MSPMLRFGASMWVVLSSPALACELDDFHFKLPGETDEAAQLRSEAINDDYYTGLRLKREESAFKASSAIYLGEVVQRTEARMSPERIEAPRVTQVKPIIALKGGLPNGLRNLQDDMQFSQLCTDIGDGEGANASVGALVVIFEGAPKTEERPRGSDSLSVANVRTTELLDKLRDYADSQGTK